MKSNKKDRPSPKKLRAWVIRKLFRQGYIGRRHCGIDDILRPLRHDERSRRIVKDKIIPELLKEEMLLSPHKDRYSINPRKMGEVKIVLKKYFPELINGIME
ncbi:MAG: hypothetical protein J7K68_01970 [Candidatus Diapherotrites archaeon]|nr:hypothetical protein [Candidatus Diapherotrites archaeon]